MNIITIAFCFQFLIACWPKTDVIKKIRQQYGHRTLNLVRKLEKTYLKLKKIELNLLFLEKCKTQKLVPLFCKLKPANRCGFSQKEFHSLHYKVLSLEIGVKYRTKSQLGKTFKHLSSQVKSLISFFTYLSVQQLIRSSAKNQSKGINIRHASKLEALCNGKRFDVNYLDVDKIVVNLSSSTLTDTDVHLLSRGLAFSITPQQLDRIDIQTSFESFYHQLSTGQPESNLTCLKQRL